VTLVGISTSLSHWPVWICCYVVLIAYAAVAGVSAREIWRRARIIVPFVLLAAIFLPLFRTGGEAYSVGPLTLHETGLELLVTVIAKASIGTLSAVLLGVTTPVSSLLKGMEALKAPRVLVLIASLMYRYLFVIVEEFERTRAALSSRAYNPRHALEAGPIGRAAIALFLRAHSRGERVSRAMSARGFDGSMPQLAPLAFGRRDAAFVGLMVLTLVGLRILVPTP